MLKFKKKIPTKVVKYFPELFGPYGFDLCNTSEFAYVLYINRDYPVGCVHGEVYGVQFDDESGKLRPEIIIHKFEIRKDLKGCGYGRIMYNELVDLLNPYLITLNYLDKDAYNFWKHMGFKKRRGSDELYKMI